MKRRTLIVAVPAAVAVASCGGGGGGDVASVGSGGTGISGEGVGSGGTGIFASSAVGSISGFSSVIVNGVRFETGQATLNLSDADTLKLGMTVHVRGVVSEDLQTGNASTIVSAADVRGPVDWVDPAQGYVKVWSTPIYIDAWTVFANGLTSLNDLQQGEPVQIYGLPGTGPGVRATRIERVAAVGTPVLSGTAQAVDLASSTLQVGGLRIGFIPALLQALGISPESLEGQPVRVRGTQSGSLLTGAVVEPWYPVTKVDGERLAVEGLVTRFTSLASLQVDGVPVDASRARVSGRASSIVVGARLEVAGTWNGSVLVASRIKLREVAPDPDTGNGGSDGGNGNGGGNGGSGNGGNGSGNGGSGNGGSGGSGGDGGGSGSGDADEIDYIARGNIGALRSASDFKIQGQDINAGGADVVFVKGTAADLRNGRRVLVTGSRVENDVLIARRVEFL
ncbi:hypothetical protein EZ313_22825 [Ramlibacter henchirensis]|uniref:DUF5666 domain-containing protein n=1 Tax=Ramlibacter henchirensis TaxID=204072 RepID=A0A4Z0BJB3_9BURK|nr:DUF5666 domain-containing protein [Ramlibacter henchirensis]TFY99386.1 hypothetical protein EZ313_22825 [Ramlibacter henchirensis]